MKKFTFIILLYTITAPTMMHPMKRLPEDQLEALSTKKLCTYHFSEKQNNPFELCSDVDLEMNLWGSAKKDSHHTENYDLSCISLFTPEDTTLEENYGKIFCPSHFPTTFENINIVPQVPFTTTTATRLVCTSEGCNKSFTMLTNYKAHIRTHTGEKPYTCTFEGCDKAFTQNSNLKKHIRIHTGEKPYTCTFEGCGKTFTQSNILKIHTRTHTGEKPYSCRFKGCNESFAENSSLKKHMKKHDK